MFFLGFEVMHAGTLVSPHRSVRKVTAETAE